MFLAYFQPTLQLVFSLVQYIESTAVLILYWDGNDIPIMRADLHIDPQLSSAHVL